MSRRPMPEDFPPESAHDLEWGGYNYAKYSIALKAWEAQNIPQEEKPLIQPAFGRATTIREKKEYYEKAIKEAEEGLNALRKTCPHKNTFHGTYQYRVGAEFSALICEDCGDLIKPI